MATLRSHFDSSRTSHSQKRVLKYGTKSVQSMTNIDSKLANFVSDRRDRVKERHTICSAGLVGNC
jgi:hypothetical protein